MVQDSEPAQAEIVYAVLYRLALFLSEITVSRATLAKRRGEGKKEIFVHLSNCTKILHMDNILKFFCSLLFLRLANLVRYALFLGILAKTLGSLIDSKCNVIFLEK